MFLRSMMLFINNIVEDVTLKHKHTICRYKRNCIDLTLYISLDFVINIIFLNKNYSKYDERYVYSTPFLIA